MSFFGDTDRSTFQSLLTEEQNLKVFSGWGGSSARTILKWQRLCEKMFNLCCRKDPTETMFTFYNATPSGSSSSDPILEYQQMIQLMKNMLFSYYPDITPKSLWEAQATTVPAQRDTQGFGTPVPVQRDTQGFGTPVPVQRDTQGFVPAQGFDDFFRGNTFFGSQSDPANWAPPDDPAPEFKFSCPPQEPSKNPEEVKEEENPKN